MEYKKPRSYLNLTALCVLMTLASSKFLMSLPTEYFNATGNSLATLSSPTGYWGVCIRNTSWSYSYSIDTNGSSGAYCTTLDVTDGSSAISHVNVKYRLSQWPVSNRPCSVESDEWNRYFSNDLVPHEVGHAQSNVDWNTGSVPAGYSGKVSYQNTMDTYTANGSGTTGPNSQTDAETKLAAQFTALWNSDIKPEIEGMHSAYHALVGTPQPNDNKIKCP